MNAQIDTAHSGIGDLRDAVAALTERLQAVEARVGADQPEPAAGQDDERSIIAVTKLKGFCSHGGRIFTHETGYCGKGTLSTDRSVFYVPTPDVEQNREEPPETIESLFTPLGNRQRVVLLRALHHDTPMGAGALRDASDLTEGQFYHHMGELHAQGYVAKGGQDRYELSEKGKLMLVVAEALAADLAGSR